MPDPERPEGGEPTEGGERTRESEIKANVELWKDLGVEVDEVDVRAKIEELPEVEGFDVCIYMPEKISGSVIIDKINTKSPNIFWILNSPISIGDNMNRHMNSFREPRSNEKGSYAITCRYQIEPDSDGLGKDAKSARDWAKTGESFLSPREYMIAQLRWNKEQGLGIRASVWDRDNRTIFPDCRAPNRKTPIIHFNPRTDRIEIGAVSSKKIDPENGPRRVITKDTKV